MNLNKANSVGISANVDRETWPSQYIKGKTEKIYKDPRQLHILSWNKNFITKVIHPCLTKEVKYIIKFRNHDILGPEYQIHLLPGLLHLVSARTDSCGREASISLLATLLGIALSLDGGLLEQLNKSGNNLENIDSWHFRSPIHRG